MEVSVCSSNGENSSLSDLIRLQTLLIRSLLTSDINSYPAFLASEFSGVSSGISTQINFRFFLSSLLSSKIACAVVPLPEKSSE